MKKHEAEHIVKALSQALEPLIDGSPDGRRAGTTPLYGKPIDDNVRIALSKGCDHKFVDGKNCAKCGMPAATLAKGLDEEALYQRFKQRFIDDAKTDPILLQLIAAQPEIVVGIEARVVELDGSTTRGRVARLMAAGWFNTARKTGTVRTELARTGADPGGGGTLSDILGAYVRDGFLVREGEGYVFAPGVKVTEKRLETA